MPHAWPHAWQHNNRTTVYIRCRRHITTVWLAAGFCFFWCRCVAEPPGASVAGGPLTVDTGDNLHALSQVLLLLLLLCNVYWQRSQCACQRLLHPTPVKQSGCTLYTEKDVSSLLPACGSAVCGQNFDKQNLAWCSGDSVLCYQVS
jgi:hypothetical protein